MTSHSGHHHEPLTPASAAKEHELAIQIQNGGGGGGGNGVAGNLQQINDGGEGEDEALLSTSSSSSSHKQRADEEARKRESKTIRFLCFNLTNLDKPVLFALLSAGGQLGTTVAGAEQVARRPRRTDRAQIAHGSGNDRRMKRIHHRMHVHPLALCLVATATAALLLSV